MAKKSNLAFGKKNYLLLIIGIGLLILGFFIMTLDNADYGFGFMGITLGPIIVMAGFAMQFFAILSKDKPKE